MRNKKITRDISQGMYILTTKDAGCCVDAVSMVNSEEQPLISVSVMKKNNTNEVLKNNSIFALSVLSKNVDSKVIETFGYHSMRDYNKFDHVKTPEIMGVNIVDDYI